MENNPGQILFYTTNWCPDCRRAKFFLKRKGIEFVEINIDEHPEGEKTVRELNNGNRSVPTIVFPDGSFLTEPSTAELEAKLNLSNQ